MAVRKSAVRPTSRAGDEYQTPWALVQSLEVEFGPFTLDPAATGENAKAPKFYTREQDGLEHPWTGTVFCNPPYGGKQLIRWTKKAREASLLNRATVVMLLPAWTESDWFHDVVWGHAEVRFMRQRVKFVTPDGRTDSRPIRASMLVIFRPFGQLAMSIMRG